MRETVVLNPGFGLGHMVPMVELAKLFLRRGLAVTIVVVEPPPIMSPTGGFSTALARTASANPSIHFHVLPAPDAAPPAAGGAKPAHPVVQAFELTQRTNAPLRDYLRSVLPSVRALVLDLFCVDVLDVAAELDVPAYLFYTSSASTLAVSLYLPYMQAKVGASFGEIGDAPLSFPGNVPFKPTELPRQALDHNNDAYKMILGKFERLPEFRGILVNTFESLEARAVRALKDDECVPGRHTPPVYCVGPLVSGGGENCRHECLVWLDAQPENSVVFLCFGSMGTLPKEQLHEIAIGLEMSGHRFLWVVRTPQDDGPNMLADAAAVAEPDLGALLPEGFLERTRGRGLVVKSWAPQVDVLRHSATGVFVTHCGWNSTLEGITAGLPLLCWPLYAEQRQNKVFIVEEMRAGVEMTGGGDEGMVTAEEVKLKLKSVMESEGGRTLRERALAAKEKALEAMKEGGASHVAFAEFLRDLDNVWLQRPDA